LKEKYLLSWISSEDRVHVITCLLSFTTHTCVWHILSTLAFVTRFIAEELPPHIKKHIEEKFQEWEENLFKVSVKLMNQIYVIVL